jgi:hypothetical protein
MILKKINDATFEPFDSTEIRKITFDLDIIFHDEIHTLIFEAMEKGEFEYSDGDDLTPTLSTMNTSTYEVTLIHLYNDGVLVPSFGIGDKECEDVIDNYYEILDILSANKQLAR